MANSTAVPPLVFTPAGIAAPTEAEILAGVQADQQAAFGGGMRTGLSTPQGQLATSLAAIVGAKNDEVAALVNQVDPDTASGRWQDAIARIYFIDRLPATPTTVAVVCIGAAGTVIPVGARVQATDGTIYAATDGGTIPASGSITLQFSATVTGPIAAPANTVTAIYQAITGWDTVNNPSAGVVGSDIESRADFEYRRRQSVALNARGSLPSIYAAVFDVDGVTDVYVAENVTASNMALGSLVLGPHSIYVAAVGGLASDIARAIWTKKSVGANYNGNTTVQVTDDSGYSPPLPTYAVTFQRPPAIPVKFDVKIVNTPGLPSDIVAQVRAALLRAFSGGDGGPRARIGSTLYASRYYAPVSAIREGYVQIQSLLLGTTTPNQAAVTLDPAGVPTLTASDISVTLV